MNGNYYCFETGKKIDIAGMKIYIAGKITGLPNYKERFAAAEKYLRSLGAIVMNPAALPVGYEQKQYLHICHAMIDVNQAIYFLTNWKESPGANDEFTYGGETGKLLLYESELDPAWVLDEYVESKRNALGLNHTERNSGLYYSMGYSDGFAKGQEQGIKIAAEVLKIQTGQTITFQMPDEGQARDILNAFGIDMSRHNHRT